MWFRSNGLILAWLAYFWMAACYMLNDYDWVVISFGELLNFITCLFIFIIFQLFNFIIYTSSTSGENYENWHHCQIIYNRVVYIIWRAESFDYAFWIVTEISKFLVSNLMTFNYGFLFILTIHILYVFNFYTTKTEAKEDTRKLFSSLYSKVLTSLFGKRSSRDN